MKNTVNTICLRKPQILASSLRANISALPIKISLGFCASSIYSRSPMAGLHWRRCFQTLEDRLP